MNTAWTHKQYRSFGQTRSSICFSKAKYNLHRNPRQFFTGS